MDEETKQLLRDLNSVLQNLAAFLACYLANKALDKGKKKKKALKKPKGKKPKR